MGKSSLISYHKKIVKLTLSEIDWGLNLTTSDGFEVVGYVHALYDNFLGVRLIACDQAPKELKDYLDIQYNIIKSIKPIEKIDLPLYLGYPMQFSLLAELLKESVNK